MRRVILAVTGTIAGLVALLSFRSHVPSSPVAATVGGAGSGSSSSSPSSASTSPPKGGGQTEAAPGAFPQGSLAGTLAAGETAVNGKVASTSYGPVQIQLIERSGKIVKVAVLVQPLNTLNDIQIGKVAFPKLISETLSAQNAKIDAVSGATYTSAGYVQSLQSALDKAT
jgi:uncharacterized protein with FMN-binding domain